MYAKARLPPGDLENLNGCEILFETGWGESGERSFAGMAQQPEWTYR